MASGQYELIEGYRSRTAYRELLADGLKGQALLEALSVLALGTEADPHAIGDGLSVLTSLGLAAQAQQIAVELILSGAEA